MAPYWGPGGVARAHANPGGGLAIAIYSFGQQIGNLYYLSWGPLGNLQVSQWAVPVFPGTVKSACFHDIQAFAIHSLYCDTPTVNKYGLCNFM